jgi:arylformamidase
MNPTAPVSRPRVKGPIVWLDMDQQELDDAYDQQVYAPNRDLVRARRAANNKIALARVGQPERVAYGDAEIEKLDIYKTKTPNAPVMLYIHGGAWKGGTSSQVAYMSEVFINAGVHFIAIDFNNCTEVGGSLFPMVDQVRRAIAWTWRNAKSFGGDPERIYVTGHSSGGHLAGCVAITEWEKMGLPRNTVKGILCASGMYDLKAPRLSKRSQYVAFTDEMEHELSPQRHIGKIHTPIIITYGSLETPEFQRQGRDFHAALVAAGKPVKLYVGEAYNHFETQETMHSPYGLMGHAIFELMGMTK